MTAAVSFHLTSSPLDWYAARAAGIVAYLLLTAVVSLGLGLAGRRLKRWPRFAVEDVHRFGGLLVGAFIAIHIVTVALDSFAPFTLTQLLVPLTSRYRPLWIAGGIVAAELLLALAVTNRFRDRIPHRVWRRLHYVNFAVWGAATLHGLGSGTDRSAPWAIVLYAGASATVATLLARRLGHLRLGLAAGALAAAAVVALELGPLQLHAKTWNAPSFTEPLQGKILVQQGVTEGIVSMAGNGTGKQKVLVRADLLVRARSLASTSFQLEYLPSGKLCTGKVTKVRPTGFSASCTMRDGARRAVDASWNLAPDGSGLSGTLAARPL